MQISWSDHLQALREAQIWCTQHLKPEHLAAPMEKDIVEFRIGDSIHIRYATHLKDCLRSEILSPQGYPDEWDHARMYPEEIDRLIQKRQQLLQPAVFEGIKGRILCVGEETDTAMGEGVSASDGLIDDTYLPPWDTWFAYLAGEETRSGILLAWIPDPLQQKVQAALEVAATQPLIWLDQINHPHEWGGNPMQERLAQEAYVALIEGQQQ